MTNKSYNKQEILAILDQEASKRGLSAEGLTVLKKIMNVESAGKVNAAATGRSSAVGLFQVIDGTWNGYADKLGLDRTNSKNGDGRLDPRQQAIFGVVFIQANEAQLKLKLDRQPNEGELYLAHFAGAQGASDVLTAPDNKMIKDILSPEAIAANGVKKDNNGNTSKGVRLKLKDGSDLLFKDFTAGDLKVWANRKMSQPDGYETMTPEARAKYRKDNGISDDTPDSFGDMVMSFIEGAMKFVVSIFKGAGEGLGNLLSPSTPSTATIAGKSPPTQLG